MRINANPLRRVQTIVQDSRDKRESNTPPLVSERHETPAEAVPLAERLLPQEVQDQFFKATEQMPPGHYRARIAVGTVEDGTRHPHDFILHKEDDAIVIYFVDPEHQMGDSENESALGLPRKGDFRPKISNLVGVRMERHLPVPDISILRYRTAAIPDQRLLKLKPQLEMATQMLATGTLPEILHGKEKEITFWLDVRPTGTNVQSRYANLDELTRFMRGRFGLGS